MSERRILALGVFDLFHVGHLRYIEYAKQQGTHLTVAVMADAVGIATKNKRPVIAESERLEIIRSLRCVDEAYLQPCSTEYEDEAAVWIAAWDIHHVVGGGGWEGSPRWNRLIPALDKRGISASFAPYTEGVSTTQLLSSILQSAGGEGIGA